MGVEVDGASKGLDAVLEPHACHAKASVGPHQVA